MRLNEDMVKPKSGSLQTHDNLSEESWLVPWCLWEQEGGLFISWLCVLLMQGCGTGIDLREANWTGQVEVCRVRLP